MNHISKPLVLLGAVIIIAAAGIYLYLNAPGGTLSFSPEVKQLAELKKSGDFENAVKAYGAIASDPSQSANDRASAVITKAGAGFHVSGDIESRLQDVRDLKQVVLDPAISQILRVQALNTLASQYRDSGRNQQVFEEAFKGDPFNKYFIASNPELSIKQLFDWSYSQKPTAVAAITLAKWYSEQGVFNANMPDQQKQIFIDSAEDYLEKANAAAAQEAKDPEAYKSTTSNVIYQTFRAYIIGRLARQVGEPYESQYRNAFEQFFKYVQESKNDIAFENEFYARFTYAIELNGDKDQKASKAQLDILAHKLDALTDPDVNGFVQFLRNTHANQPNGANWKMMPKLFALSPEFKTTVERLIATPAVSGTAANEILDGY